MFHRWGCRIDISENMSRNGSQTALQYQSQLFHTKPWDVIDIDGSLSGTSKEKVNGNLVSTPAFQ
ncbi:hypothetical protein [Pasteurella canis]|uniref:hypothetical protein n=1 Tax=Pasteurella canis TaxID=753 RepID=UPI001E451372|nr:hypothetical protein [Pasteurella canis]